MAYKKSAGRSTREMARRRRKSAVWVAVIGIGIIAIIVLVTQNAKTFGIGGFGILALIVLMQFFGKFIERDVDAKLNLERRAILGAKAEEKVGELLDGLPDDEYYVLNDIESPYGNIDHIVIAKNGGIFLLETKAHGGRVEMDGEMLLVNGKTPEKNFIAQALQNSYWLRDQISEIVGSKPWITPVIVFTNAFVPRAKPSKGVWVVNKKYLVPLLLRTAKPNAVLTQIWETRAKIENKLS